MGMTIDEAQKILSNGLTNASSEYEWCAAFIMAIETMRKYQKIKQIIKDHDNDRIPEDYWYIDKIKEVIKDGKID